MASTGSAAPKRRILFIEKAFQFRFIAKMTAVIVLGTVLTGGLLYLLADVEFGRAFHSAHYQARSSWELLLPAVLTSSFLSMCLVAGIAVVLTLYDSHRIGGPLYRFKLNLEAIGRGDLSFVTRLRDGDELQALTEAMNEMTQGLRERVGRAKEAADGARLRLAEVRGAGGGEGIEEVDAALATLQATLGEFRI